MGDVTQTAMDEAALHQTVHASYRGRHARTTRILLVEMLAALVILGLALGALYQAASGATRNARVSAEYAIATTLAESELDAFVISRPDVGVTQRGRYGDYEWERWVELIPEREQSGIGWMRIVVSWSGESQPRTVSLSTIGRLSEGAGDAS